MGNVRQIIDITLEEAAELYNRGLIKNKDGRDETYFSEQRNLINPLGFMPLSLSELSHSILSEEMPSIEGKTTGRTTERRFLDKTWIKVPDTFDRYTSGRVYAARKIKDKIELVHVKVIRSEDWTGRSPGNDFIYGWTCGSKDEEECWSDGPIIYQLFRKDNLDLKSVVESNSIYGRNHFEIGERATIQELSELPLWENSEDYKKFMRKVYGAARIDNELSRGEKSYVTYPGELSSNWKLLTGCLSTRAWCDTNQYILCTPRPNLTLRIALNPKEEKNADDSLETYLLKKYVQPKNLGNGIIAMNEDRIPQYLMRVLGL